MNEQTCRLSSSEHNVQRVVAGCWDAHKHIDAKQLPVIHSACIELGLSLLTHHQFKLFGHFSILWWLWFTFQSLYFFSFFLHPVCLAHTHLYTFASFHFISVIPHINWPTTAYVFFLLLCFADTEFLSEHWLECALINMWFNIVVPRYHWPLYVFYASWLECRHIHSFRLRAAKAAGQTDGVIY